MGVKNLVEDKFLALCSGICEYPNVTVSERSKTGTSFSFEMGNNQSIEICIDWDDLVDFISDISKLDEFLRENLSDETDAIDDDDNVEDDPFSSGELVFDSDGRVHFACDLQD